MIFPAFLVVVIGCALFKCYQEKLLKQVLAPLLTFLLIVLISGHVYNGIEQVPFLVTQLDGKVALVSDQFHGQFQAEAWIVTLLYLAAVCSFISMIEGQKQYLVGKSSGVRRTLFGLVLFVASYNGICYVGRFKVSDI